MNAKTIVFKRLEQAIFVLYLKCHFVFKHGIVNIVVTFLKKLHCNTFICILQTSYLLVVQFVKLVLSKTKPF